MIDPQSIGRKVANCLPTHVRWLVGEEYWDYDFSRAKAPLRRLEEANLNGSCIEQKWTDLYLFGESQFAEGGGSSPFLGVHGETGEICGLDVEREGQEVFLLNSDVERFILTFLKIDELLRSTSPPPLVLSRALMEIDPHAFPRSDWKLFSEYIESELGAQ